MKYVIEINGYEICIWLINHCLFFLQIYLTSVFPLIAALVQRDNNSYSSRYSIAGVYTWRRVNRFPSTTLYACYMCFCTACNCSYWEFVFMSKPCFYLSVRRWRKLLNKLIAEMISCCQEQIARERRIRQNKKTKDVEQG